MKRRTARVTAQTPAAPEVVFGLLADGTTWPTWSPIESFELERPGDPPPEGPGAIRLFRRGRTTGHDELLAVEPPRLIRYASESGLPVRDYVGEIVLEPAAGGGTTIDWHSSFFPTSPPGTGWLVERGIARFLRQCARGLASHAATLPARRDAAAG